MTPTKQQLSSEISNAARNGHPFYVYALSDTQGVFYIGKGTKNRLFDHFARREKDTNKAKQQRLMASSSVVHTVLAYFNDEESAYRHEATLIRETKGLTNIALGDWLEPIERVREQARGMLNRIVPFEQCTPTKEASALIAAMGAASARDLYDRIKGEILKQISNPAPTSISFGKDGRETGRRYNERHGMPFQLRRAA